MRITVTITPGAALARRSSHDDYVFAMREGRRQRAVTFKAHKGKGSYTRRSKYRFKR